MLKSVRYRNFKRYSDVAFDTSKPVTVLVGPNSSGKSSLIKGLLAFKQTWGDPTDHPGFVSEGEYVDIGPFEEYSKDHNTKNEVKFSFEVSIDNRQGPLFAALAFERAFITIVHTEDPQTKQGRVTSYDAYFTNDDSVNIFNFEECVNHISFGKMKTSEESYRMWLSSALFDRLFEILKRSILRGQEDSKESLKQKLFGKLERGSIRAYRDNQRGMHFRDLDSSGDDLFALRVVHELLLQASHHDLVQSLTKKLFALAGLRQKPTRSVRRTDEAVTVGSAGQNAASVYADLRQKYIKAGSRQSRARETFSRLEGWMFRLGLAKSVEMGSWRDLVDMRPQGAKANKSDSIVDVGGGFSQAAPILIQLAAMPDEAMLVVEQPELHLFPRSQTILGQILCEEAKRGGKNLIIETHSEHLIHGIQLHISEGRGRSSHLGPNDIQVIYVDADADVVELELDEFGEFHSEWPMGFFDQTLNVYQTIFANKNK